MTDELAGEPPGKEDEEATAAQSDGHPTTPGAAEATPGAEVPDAKAATTSSPDEDPQAVIRNVVNNYIDGDIFTNTIGVGYGGEGGGPRHRRVTGRLPEEEISDLVRRYAPPASFEDAAESLRSKHVVVLEGQAGTGRRAGAIALLREIVKGPIVALSPLLTVKELAERKYQKGTGYLVADRVTERHTAEVGVGWTGIRNRVQDSRSHLVVTTTATATAAASREVPHLTWVRPTDEDVLRGQLAGQGYLRAGVDEIVERVITALPDEGPLTRLADLATLIADGVDPDAALARLGENAGREVSGWFAENRTLHETLEVTALCFIEGTDLRTFEASLDQLRAAVLARLPARQAKALRQSLDPLGDRRSRVDGHDLMGIKGVGDGLRTSRVLAFRDAAYGPAVLEHLWRTQSAIFWDAVAQWLDGVVTDGGAFTVARGLAHLARTDYDEVERLYLERWSADVLGTAGRAAAVYVLWSASRDRLAQAALQTAVRWAGERDRNRRWTALVAFAGDLGICYPTDAVNRIWQLTAQTDDLSAAGFAALASLFAVLVDETPEVAHTVLNLLELKVDKHGPGRVRDRIRAHDLGRIRWLILSAVLAVVSASSPRSRRSAIFEYLHEVPARTDVVGRLWAELIEYRPYRRAALIALHRGLHALRDIATDPLAAAGEFGGALSAPMSAEQKRTFTHDFTMIDRQLRRGTTDSPADVLLACLDAMAVHATNGGHP